MEWNDESKKGGGFMAIEKVVATIAEESSELLETTENTYTGELIAPYDSGNYQVEISSYDDSGNVTVSKSNILEVSLWSEPKTNWTKYDSFNYVDYNRIKNNLMWLYKKAITLYREFEIEDMGEDILNNKTDYNFRYFNSWEENLDIINKNIFSKDYGYKMTFYGNSPFITPSELNRLESAILSMRTILDNQQAGLRRLEFRLGYQKGIKL